MYDSAGIKVRKYNFESGGNTFSNIIDYCGNFIYKDGVLDYIINENGRVIYENNALSHYEVNLTDHLGNNRVVLKDDGTVLQTANYYPFV